MDRSIKWNCIGSSQTGSSHQLTNKPCQDYFVQGCVDINADEQVFYCFVSDGAGSALFAEEGSRLACLEAENYVRSLDKANLVELDETSGYEILEIVSKRLRTHAMKQNHRPRDFACTLLGTIIFSNKIICLQVGDGGIVIREDIESAPYRLVFWPDVGEYANVTNFVTEEMLVSKVKELQTSVTEIAVFSDGIQRLCLEFEFQTVHEPFFRSMFKSFQLADDEVKRKLLQDKLISFLNSQSVNDRTDDDKTLVLGVRSAL